MRCNAHGKGEAILLIHGMPTNGRLWDGVVRDLSRNFRCFAIDLPGMGGTPFLPYSPSWFALVAEQIEQVRTRYDIQRWHVVGHDGGCAVALQYAHLYPKRVACMAMLSPAIFSDLRPFFLLDLLRKPVLGELAAPLVHTLFWRIAMRQAIPDGQYGSQRASFQETFSGWAGPWKLMRLVRWGKPRVIFDDSPAMLRSLGCATLVIHGSRDILPESFARRAAGLIANSQLLELDSAHFIPFEKAAQVAQHLTTFFRSRGAEQVGHSSDTQGAQRPTHGNEIPTIATEVAFVPHAVA